MFDVSVYDHGTLIGLTALTEAGDQWMTNNFCDNVPHIGPTRFCEPRYADDIINGMKTDGLELEI